MNGYFMAPVRGLAGNNATIPEMDRNIEKALVIAQWLRDKYPEIEWIIPHEHELIIRQLWLDGISAEKIVNAWAAIASTCDFGVIFDGDGISDGMKAEADAMSEKGKPIAYMDETGDEAELAVEIAIAEVGLEVIDLDDL